LLKRIPANNLIRADQVRLIDEKGNQMGIVSLPEALRAARERNLDLIQVTEKVVPPVCKIGNLGKYFYQQKKKEKSAKDSHQGEMKGIRLSFAISDHDLQIRADAAEKFLKEKHKVRIEMTLRGREKAHQDFAREKIKKLFEILEKTAPIKVERELKKEFGGLTMIISR
jgi:translation initiation factor IF-3